MILTLAQGSGLGDEDPSGKPMDKHYWSIIVKVYVNWINFKGRQPTKNAKLLMSAFSQMHATYACNKCIQMSSATRLLHNKSITSTKLARQICVNPTNPKPPQKTLFCGRSGGLLPCMVTWQAPKLVTSKA